MNGPEFWHERWATNQIGFHEGAPNRHLVRFWPVLPPQSRVLVPLCGKSLDVRWLAERGHRVIGVELSSIAIEALFAGSEPQKSPRGPHTAWTVGPVTILEGDIFAGELPAFDAVWDRAALVALPRDLRPRYAELTRGPGLLVSFVYDPSRREGPPFSVPDDEVRALYPGAEPIHREAVTEERWKAVGAVEEVVWRV